MTTNEIEMINIIRESKNPEQALLIAINVISEFLEQLQEVPKPRAVCPRESA